MSLLATIQDYQRGYSEQLATLMHQMQTGDSLLPAISLIAIGFVYGFLHAIGPGHGKLVITGYMMADHTTLKRGMVLATISSLLQALTAITLMLVVFYGFGLAKSQAESIAKWLEIVSFSLIALLGLILIFRGLSKLKRIHHHAHHHHHGEHCSHAHTPEAPALDKAGLREMAFMALSIGIRPCSGALILLFFACLLGVTMIGILATLAMAVGTAIATCMFALLAVKSKEFALRFMAQSETKMAYAESALTLISGIIIAFAASIFLLSAMPDETGTPPPSHPLMRSQ